MEEFDYTLDEIREQLEQIGYKSIDDRKLVQFKRDLQELVRKDRSHTSGWATDTSVYSTDASNSSPHVNGYRNGQAESTGSLPYRTSQILSDRGVGSSSTGVFSSEQLSLADPTSWRSGVTSSLSTGRVSSDERGSHRPYYQAVHQLSSPATHNGHDLHNQGSNHYSSSTVQSAPQLSNQASYYSSSTGHHDYEPYAQGSHDREPYRGASTYSETHEPFHHVGHQYSSALAHSAQEMYMGLGKSRTDRGYPASQVYPEAQRSVTSSISQPTVDHVYRRPRNDPTLRSRIPEESDLDMTERSQTDHMAEADHTADLTEYSSDARPTDKQNIKRKVRRKIDGHSVVCDESTLTESEFDLSSLPESNYSGPVRRGAAPQKSLERPKTAPSKGKLSSNRSGSYHRPGSVMSGLSQQREPPQRESSQSLIRPMTAHPHTQNLKRHDPVNRHEIYRREWQNYKFPSEEQHLNLRWETRAMMVCHNPVAEKKSHRFTVNTYKTPAEKKRKDVIWETRQNMARGVVPARSSKM